MEAFNSLCGVIRGPQYSFFFYLKKCQKERKIHSFYNHYLVDLLISEKKGDDKTTQKAATDSFKKVFL